MSCGLDPLTCFACLHVSGNPFVHVGPPKVLGDLCKGFFAAQVADGRRIMRLREDVILYILIIWDENPWRFVKLHPVMEKAVCQLISVEPRLLTWRQPFCIGVLGCGKLPHKRRETLVVSVCFAYTII